jgi:hypothetical protein
MIDFLSMHVGRPSLTERRARRAVPENPATIMTSGINC